MTESTSARARAESRCRGDRDDDHCGCCAVSEGELANRVRVRELVPDDVHVLHAVFDGLSPRSRYLRYQTVAPDLSPSTVHALSTPDGRDHLALGAFEDVRPIGIARLFGLGGGRAELAVEVVDSRQVCGIGPSWCARCGTGLRDGDSVRDRCSWRSAHRAWQRGGDAEAGDELRDGPVVPVGDVVRPTVDSAA